MEDAPPPYTAVPNSGYVKPPSAPFLATHPSPAIQSYTQGPGETHFRPTSDHSPNGGYTKLAAHPSATRQSYTQGPGETHFKPTSDHSPNGGYTKLPSASFLATHPSAAAQSNTQGPGDIQFRPTNPSSPRPSPNMSSESTFPESFGIYHASGSTSDMMIAISADAQPIFHVSTHSGFSSQPSVVLHSSPHESSSPMATADFHSFSSVIDIMLFNQPLKLDSEGAFKPVRIFTYPMPQANGQTVLEVFRWKHSSGPEVQALQGSTHGYKCVREKTGEVVAAWARPNSGYKKKGKMRFLMRDRMADDRFETCVVITMLAIMEKLRRTKKNSSRGGVVGGAGA